MMGYVQSKKNVQIKNMLSKNHKISSVSGEIILKKDEDFDILCFDIDFDEFLSTRVCLWRINSPSTAPPILGSDDTGPDPDDSSYNCQ